MVLAALLKSIEEAPPPSNGCNPEEPPANCDKPEVTAVNPAVNDSIGFKLDTSPNGNLEVSIFVSLLLDSVPLFTIESILSLIESFELDCCELSVAVSAFPKYFSCTFPYIPPSLYPFLAACSNNADSNTLSRSVYLLLTNDFQNGTSFSN